MKWYYSQNNERHGPLTAGELTTLALPADTLVWHDGLPDWVPLQSVQAEVGAAPGLSPRATSVAPVPAPGAPAGGAESRRCVECGYLFPRAEVIELEGKCVCARCKPLFLQKMREGVPLGGAQGVWRRKREMIVALGATLPERCVQCNLDAPGQRLKRDLYWHTPVLYVMILFPGLIFYALVALLVRKRATLQIGLCATHRAKRRQAIGVAWACFGLGVATMILGAVMITGENTVWAVVAGGVVMLGGTIFGVVRSRIVSAKKIDKEHAYVAGVCPEFLAQLPEWTGK